MSLLRRQGAVFDLSIEGADSLVRPLLTEAGGHRFQRIPPTERRGRVQSSSTTVSVFEILSEQEFKLLDRDIKIFTTTAGGPGGQHQNKTQSAVVMRHLPTGIEASSSERCQHQNKRIARAVLEARVAAMLSRQHSDDQNAKRRAQAGLGERADKIRTYREQDDTACDHRSNAKTRYSEIKKGRLERLFQ